MLRCLHAMHRNYFSYSFAHGLTAVDALWNITFFLTRTSIPDQEGYSSISRLFPDSGA